MRDRAHTEPSQGGDCGPAQLDSSRPGSPASGHSAGQEGVSEVCGYIIRALELWRGPLPTVLQPTEPWAAMQRRGVCRSLGHPRGWWGLRPSGSGWLRSLRGLSSSSPPVDGGHACGAPRSPGGVWEQGFASPTVSKATHLPSPRTRPDSWEKRQLCPCSESPGSSQNEAHGLGTLPQPCWVDARLRVAAPAWGAGPSFLPPPGNLRLFP